MTTTPPEATFRPTTVYNPGEVLLAWPPAFDGVRAEYEATHRAWSIAHLALHEALAAVPRAEREDSAALTRTVRSGTTPDKGGRAERARRDVAVAVERTAHARELATAATDALKAVIAERGHELVPAVVASLRGAAEDYAGALERARGEVNTAGARLRDAASLPHLIRATLDRAGVGTPDLGTPEGPAWPINPTGSLMGRLDRLEREWQRATSTTTTA